MSSFSTIPKTQNAWMVVRQGKPEIALEFKTGVPRRSACQKHDLAGVIVDANGSSFSNGDEVIGYIPVCKSHPLTPIFLHDAHPGATTLQFSSRQGALAQYATLPVDNVILKPAKLSWEEAAGLSLAAQTAVQSLRLGGYDPTRWLSLNPTSTPTPSNQEAIFFNGGSTRSSSPKPCRST
ncbi:hypothetical protein JVT61DRAFT_4620 [Boletus reticuloceps]|uniref:Uncharacterized protein n=1 Tax=Boletus reticuloceps TaxID=495285 RepID=A0A8I3A8K6_9AGAM|nr:hypothetical protein JVT61DRAFT_4620 [Boletus reticuloceps]